MKSKIAEFVLSERKASVEKARSINKIMSARCQVNSSKAGPTAKELLNQQIGKSGMMHPRIRETVGETLKRIGVVQLQTIHEKFDKAFDQLTLTNEEKRAKMEDMARRRLNKDIIDSSDGVSQKRKKKLPVQIEVEKETTSGDPLKDSF